MSVKKGCDLVRHADAGQRLARRRDVLLPRLLHEADAAALLLRQQRQRARHEAGKDARPLAAAEDEQAESPSASGAA